MLPVHVRRATGLIAAALAAAALASACTTDGLVFRKDTRLSIVAPRDRSAVTLPFDVRWTVRDLAVGGAGGHTFGVLVDRAPPRPGHTLASLIDDAGCRAQAGCPDAAYLADRNIFRTSDTHLEIAKVSAFGVEGRRERHEVTVVVLGADGRRVGESAYSVEFEIDRRKP